MRNLYPPSAPAKRITVWLAEDSNEVMSQLESMQSHYSEYANLISHCMWAHSGQLQRDFIVIEFQEPSTGLLFPARVLAILPVDQYRCARVAITHCDRPLQEAEVTSIKATLAEIGYSFDPQPTAIL